jgi:hypothetical protein
VRKKAHAGHADLTDAASAQSVESAGDQAITSAGDDEVVDEMLKSRKIADKNVFGFSRVPGMERRENRGVRARK